jgi:hypothetical protein
MIQAIIEKIRKNRQFDVEAGGLVITARRPTNLEMEELPRDGATIRNILSTFVVDWNARENDLIAGGTPEEVPFSTALFMEWAEDRPEAWAPIISKIKDQYAEHKAKVESSLEKPEAG